MKRFARCLVMAALTVVARGAAAAPARNVCVPDARGVPTRNEPPKWVAWTGSPGLVDVGLDDPRWQGATGHAFASGGAKAPLQMRALWSNQGGEYLYMSFIMDVEGLTGAGVETPRDLFLGFRRTVPFDPGTPLDATDDQYGYVFQFHLTTGSSPGLVEPIHCARPVDSAPGNNDGCAETAAVPKDYWRLYADLNQPSGTCAGSTSAQHFSPLTGPGGVMDSPAPWVASKQAVRYWKLSPGNRWAIQLRIPLVGPGQALGAGIERNATFWYQATSRAAAGDFTNVGWWPRNELTSSLCYSEFAGGFLDHAQLNNPDNYSRITNVAAAGAAGCDKGIKLETAGVGSFADFTGSATDLTTMSPTVNFKAVRADGVTPVVNTVIAQPENTSGAAIQQPLLARFRLAAWGSAPWSDPLDTGKWKDMRGTVPTLGGQQPGLCLGNSDPNADDRCTPAVNIDAGKKAAITFQWTIGSDTGSGGIGASEYCKFGLTPPAGSGVCQSCTCGASCDALTDPGIQSTKPSGGAGAVWPCVSKNYQHQCMLVELSSPNGAVDFVQQSAWNNMNFGQMSTVAREALLDARGLPTVPGQAFQDLYFMVMPRNLPAAVPAGATLTGLIHEAAIARADKTAAPYLADVARLSQEDPERLARIEAELKRGRRGQGDVPGRLRASRQLDDRRISPIRRALLVMPNDDFERVANLLALAGHQGEGAHPNDDLVQAAVTVLGPSEAAQIVPTLDIYPFYRPGDRGNAYQPMTSFTLFLSHESTLGGMRYEIDGADKVGANIYHLRIPVGFARKIQVRAQALSGNEAVLIKGQPRWPCGTCCTNQRCGLVAQLSNTVPGMIAGAFVVGRRRRRKPAAPKQAA